MLKTLKNNGLRITKGRIAVLKALSSEKYPADIETLYKKLNKKEIDLVTLYRIIAIFEEKGIVKRVNLKKDTAFYELCQNHHHHMICIKCEKIEDFENKDLENLLKKISRNSLKFKNITDHSLELFGLCRGCA